MLGRLTAISLRELAHPAMYYAGEIEQLLSNVVKDEIIDLTSHLPELLIGFKFTTTFSQGDYTTSPKLSDKQQSELFSVQYLISKFVEDALESFNVDFHIKNFNKGNSLYHLNFNCAMINKNTFIISADIYT